VGLISASNAWVTSATEFHLLRFFLGAAEAGFVPGIFFYLTLWFPPSYRGRFIASFMAAAPLSGVVGGPLSGSILSLGDVLGLHSWQWLFLIEGLPASLLAFAVLKFLPDGPATARWLGEDEKRVIASSSPPKTRLSIISFGAHSPMFASSHWGWSISAYWRAPMAWRCGCRKS
jgi:ACS family tartrate transporter-like MFS transporter